MTTVRASALPAYADCQRRAVAIVLAKDKVRQWKWNPTEDVPHISAIVGTLLHQTAQSRLGDQGYLEKLLMMEGAIRYDNATPDKETAARQCVRMAEELERALGSWSESDLVEAELSARIEGVDLTGHPDRVVFAEGSKFRCDVHDLKTSARDPGCKHVTQLGAYGLLLEAKDYQPQHGFVHHLPRTPLSMPQEPVTTRMFDMGVCADQAMVVLRQIRDAAELSAGDLPANPMSMLCSKQWCPAHGQEFCPITLPVAVE